MTAITKINQPKDYNISVWRYMNLKRFEYLLKTESLYFARADMFEDDFEGSLTQPAYTGFLINCDVDVQYEDGTVGKMSEWISNDVKAFRTQTYINCWHMNERESDAMWKLYASSKKSIAIKTTYKCLAESLPNDAHLGMVRYIDYNKNHFPFNSLILQFFHKRKEFEHDKEVRAVITKGPPMTRKIKKPTGNDGLPIKVDVFKLIKKIVVAPKSSDEIYSEIQTLLKNHGFKLRVDRSSLEEKPIF